MKMKALTLVTALPLALAVAGQASAADGFYVSGFVNNNTLEHSLERDTGTNTTPSITSKSDETDVGFGVGIGYKLHVAEDVFLGAEAFYTKEDVKTTNLNNLLRTEVSLESTYGARLLAGIDITPKVAVYGFAGATRLDFDLRNSYPFAPPVRTATEKETAFNFGFGFAYSINKNLSLIGEYSQINDVDFDPIPEVAVAGKINENELDLSSWKLGLNYSF
ncbi:porin family protein [Parendozoicomonas sp. Alg238-R29]|uniref:outer membrane protein n=1 Tax=Parendozoicomonas sp. Alg238-R29 TaxID=2993446 RepID=UPI00248E7D06|nr:porin family protein [Parendozoicomonas sp. Alg238-R29]